MSIKLLKIYKIKLFLIYVLRIEIIINYKIKIMIIKTIQIHEITFDELAEKVANKMLIKIESYLQELHEKGNDVYLTRNETVELLKIDPSTLWSWTKKGKLNSYGISNRRYYHKKEIIDYLKSNQLKHR